MASDYENPYWDDIQRLAKDGAVDIYPDVHVIGAREGKTPELSALIAKYGTPIPPDPELVEYIFERCYPGVVIPDVVPDESGVGYWPRVLIGAGLSVQAYCARPHWLRWSKGTLYQDPGRRVLVRHRWETLLLLAPKPKHVGIAMSRYQGSQVVAVVSPTVYNHHAYQAAMSDWKEVAYYQGRCFRDRPYTLRVYRRPEPERASPRWYEPTVMVPVVRQ